MPMAMAMAAPDARPAPLVPLVPLVAAIWACLSATWCLSRLSPLVPRPSSLVSGLVPRCAAAALLG
jgi:hypothetical protein